MTKDDDTMVDIVEKKLDFFSNYYNALFSNNRNAEGRSVWGRGGERFYN